LPLLSLTMLVGWLLGMMPALNSMTLGGAVTISVKVCVMEPMPLLAMMVMG